MSREQQGKRSRTVSNDPANAAASAGKHFLKSFFHKEIQKAIIIFKFEGNYSYIREYQPKSYPEAPCAEP